MLVVNKQNTRKVSMKKFISSKNTRLMKTLIFIKIARLLGAVLPNVSPCIIAVSAFLAIGIKLAQKIGII